jgi:hypothetical protein
VAARANRQRAQSFDTLNPSEQVVVAAGSAAGVYTVVVAGSNVPLGPQTYALAITGVFSTVNACPVKCPANCENAARGSCNTATGACVCATGFAGADCSIGTRLLFRCRVGCSADGARAQRCCR